MAGVVLSDTYSVYYHIIIVTKYRRKAITDQISRDMLETARKAAEPQGATIAEWNHDRDHVHMLVRATPTTNLARLVASIKSATARTTRQRHPETKRLLWGECLWNAGYYIATTGGASL